MHNKYLKDICGSVKADRLFDDLGRIYERDKYFSFDKFREAAEFTMRRMADIGLEDVRMIELPIDGKAVIGDFRMPWFWTVRGAELKVVEPALSEPLIASYAGIPQHLVMYSDATPPGGITAELVPVGSLKELDAIPAGALAGKILLVAFFVSATRVLRTGAIGIVSEATICAPSVNSPETQPEAVGWENAAFDTVGMRYNDGLNFFGFMISHRQGTELQDLCRRGTVKVNARVDTTLGEAKFGPVTGVLRGVELPQEEIWLTAHLHEPGAADNASGVACCIEAVRALKDMIKAGKLPGPRRSIRLLFGQECSGSGAVLAKLRKFAPGPVYGLSVDTVGQVAECHGMLRILRTLDSLPSMTDDLFQLLADNFSRTFKWLKVDRDALFTTVDNMMADPMFGAPSAALVGAPYRGYHTHEDRPETLDKDLLALVSAVAGTYVYFLASGELGHALHVARIGAGAASRRLVETGADARRRAGLSGIAGFYARDAVDFALKKEWRAMDDLERLLRESEVRKFRKETKPLRRMLADIAKAQKTLLPKMTGFPDVDEWKAADAIVPRRTVRGFLTQETLSPELKAEIKKDRSLACGLWGGTIIVTWADGERSVADIARIQGHLTGRYDLARVRKLFEFLGKCGQVTLMPRVTKEQVVNELVALGLREGDTLLLHSSLKSLGGVKGGARTVIDALLQVLGPSGNLVMPGFYDSFVSVESQKDKPGFNAKTSPSETGQITEVFRGYPGVQCSLHPTHRVLALGPDSRLFTANHARTSPFSSQGPFGRLYERDCKILFLGCGLGPNTFLHVYEDMLDMPYLRSEEVRVRDRRGKTKIVTVPKEPMGDRDFYVKGGRAGQELLEKGVITRGRVGISEVFLTTARRQGEYALRRMQEDKGWLLCRRPECKFCAPFRS